MFSESDSNYIVPQFRYCYSCDMDAFILKERKKLYSESYHRGYHPWCEQSINGCSVDTRLFAEFLQVKSRQFNRNPRDWEFHNRGIRHVDQQKASCFKSGFGVSCASYTTTQLTIDKGPF